MRKTFRIVVGMDGSAQAQRALDWAMTEATAHAHRGQPATVQVITAWERDTDIAPAATWPSRDPQATAKDILALAVTTAGGPPVGVTLTGTAVEGPVATVIGRVADGADLLVLGSHGYRHQLHRPVLGAVAEACVRDAICPVVVIPVARTSSTSHAREALASVAG